MAKSESVSSINQSKAQWTFFTNYSHVLIAVAKDPEASIRKISDLVGITERAVQNILAVLEEEGFVKKVKVGRNNRYKLIKGKSLRHSLEKHRSIGDILNLIVKKS